MVVAQVQSATVKVNGAETYHEIRGSGPTVLFISGATGDAGHFNYVAEALADEFTVVTYDRRGNSRSPRPESWTSTTMTEQADDAAALLRALGRAPAVVFGTSGGGTILVELIRRHPDVVKGAFAHEPVLMPVTPSAAEVGPQLQQMVEQGFAEGGPRVAQERFIRWAATDAVYNAIEPELRDRMLANSEVFFPLELEPMASYVPDAHGLRASGIRIVAAGGRENRGTPMVEGAEWLAREMDVDYIEVPGFHAPYLDAAQAKGFAEAIRPLLKELSGR